jgi:DsbC/DsbD-like thiol-disulfide interchange protein
MNSIAHAGIQWHGPDFSPKSSGMNGKTMNGLGKILCAGLAACGLAIVYSAPATAADTSAWSQDSKSAMRLIAGAHKASEPGYRAGIEIKLQPGWHTYWRYPGDSGVPPRFDFSGSDNVKNAKVMFPAPNLFTDETGNSIGYADNVIFPVQVTPKQSGKPVTLKLKIDYAVCEKLCIPAEGKAELTLADGASTQDPKLTAAEASVPHAVSADEAGLSLRRVNDAAKPLIAVDLKTDSDKPVGIFVEGPTLEWALPIPKPAQGAPKGHRHFGFELDGLPPGVSPKGPFDLTFTLIEQGCPPIQVTTRLD